MDVLDDVLLSVDVLTILLLEDNPVLGVVLVGLLKAVTKENGIRIALILLIIVLNTGLLK